MRFLHIAMGSACETEYHLLLARDLKFLKEKEYADLEASVTEVKRMLAGFLKTLKGNS